MEKRTGEYTFGGAPVTLLGSELKAGDKAPEFSALLNDLGEFKLSSTSGKVRIISVVPSLDTGVCELQTLRFNKEAGTLDGLEVITISVDTPFAQGRFANEHEAKNITYVSDHKDLDFGTKYGIVIEEFRLLGRGVFVIDKDDTIKYTEYVKEMTNHIDYDKALEEAKKLL